MTKRKSQTLEELVRELEADPQWVAAREERERQLNEREQVLAEDEVALVEELRLLGYSVDSDSAG